MAEIRGDTDTTIDVESLVSSINVTMSQYELFMPPQRCIFRTPTALRRHNEKAYIPDAFSIGPLHHDCPNFEATETIKAKYLQDLMSESKVSLEDYINCIGKKLERDARECYAVPIGYSPEEFVKILVIDGCFIVELFVRNASSDDLEKDPIFGMSSMVEVLYHDLILLENQVPWIVLERLFSQSKSKQEAPIPADETLIELAIKFFSCIFPFTGTDDSSDDHISDNHNLEDIKHIPDLLKKWMASSMEVAEEVAEEENSQSKSGGGLLPSATRKGGMETLPDNSNTIPLLVESGKESSSSSDQGDKKKKSGRGDKNMIPEYELIPSVTRLVEAGIEFSPSSGTGSKKILFRNGVLQIPPIKINEATETLFRNLISFEQCYPNSDDSITSYAKLLDNLINTPRDAEILSEKKILFNWLNPEDAAHLFDKLYHDTCISTYSYEKLVKKVNKYRERKWPKRRAVLMGQYFNTPWASLSTLAAVILLILTLVQTLYAIMSYY